ncbi:hypothetical protein [Kibdelosporangium phytohabitans]|nr:hypothetical protein [Kibdelosporangium phytohabitans]MBE1470779.1 hypothetical protein [Kibdelosporangium phytohabitans]
MRLLPEQILADAMRFGERDTDEILGASALNCLAPRALRRTVQRGKQEAA